jgi:hypothetical protein
LSTFYRKLCVNYRNIGKSPVLVQEHWLKHTHKENETQMKRYRNEDETLQKRFCNGLDTDTDTEEN